MTDDGILNVVEHIETELLRLGRLVATLRRRVEARQGEARHEGDEDGAAGTPISRVVGTPAPRASERTSSQSQRRMPVAAIEDSDVHDDSVLRTATGGSSYGFVREPTSAAWKKRTLDGEPAHVADGERERLDRKTR